jgi:hypothetical protein
MLIQDEEDEDEDREGDEEGYDTYEGYDEEEDDDKEDELDDIDAEVNGVTEQGTGRAEIVLESGEMVQDEAAELALSGQLQVGHIFHHLGLVQLFLKVAS